MNTHINRMEDILSHVLRGGLILSILVVLFGATLFLGQHGHIAFTFSPFDGECSFLTHLSGMFREAWALQSTAVMQVGLLILIATPVMRVFFCLLIFLRERDFLYVFFAGVVLSVLLYSFFDV